MIWVDDEVLWVCVLVLLCGVLLRLASQ